MIAEAFVAGSVFVSALVFASSGVIDAGRPFGWLGPFLIAAAMAFALWRAGAVRAWKATAEGRGQQIVDLASTMAELRQELADAHKKIADLDALPRVEGIIRLMNQQYERAEARAAVRTGDAVRVLVATIKAHDLAAEKRFGRLLELLEERPVS